MQVVRATAERVKAVNDRLEFGQGWIGYRISNGQPSKYLYYSFYRDRKQIFVNTKTNDVEVAYAKLLEARSTTERGVLILPEEASRLTYEHLRQKYVNDRPGRETSQRSQFIHLDKFFARMKATRITTETIRKYIKSRRADGVSDPTIRRELSNLRAMFNLANDERILSHDQVPYFPMPKDSLPAGTYIAPEVFERILNALPDGSNRREGLGGAPSNSNLRPLFAFLYATACRIGAARQLTRNNVSEDGAILEIPAVFTKMKKPLQLPLIGSQLELVRQEIQKRKGSEVLFDSRNYQQEWAKACAKAGVGTYDEKTYRRTGVRIHDCRCSGAINLLAAGVDEGLVLKIGGWRSRTMLDRYNVTDITRLSAAMEKGSQFVANKLAVANQ
jgi:integrase